MTVISFESDHDRSKSPSAPLLQETAKSSFDQIFKAADDSAGSQDQGSGPSALFDDTSSSLYDTSKNMDIFEGFVSSAGATLQTSPMWTSSSMMATLPPPTESSSSSPPSSMDLVSKFSPNYASTLTMNYTMSSILLDTFGSTNNQSSAITSASTTNITTTMDPMDIFPISSINMNDGVTSNGSLLLDEQMERNIYIMPLYQQIIWTIIFGTMVFVSTGGNAIVIWIVLTNKRMRTVTNYFLVNLSVADIMVSTLNVIFSFIYMLNSDWPFGELLCKVTQFTAILSVAASVFTLMAISIDRYLAIVHPLRPRMSRTTTVNIIVVIWITSSLLSLPNIICATTFVEKFKNGDSRVVCYLEWWDGMSTKSRIEYIYNVIILLVTYVLPIASMSYTYFCVGCELWGSQSIGECQTARQMENIKSKRKIVKMMMIVVAIFGLCWAPYHIYFLLAHHYQQIIDSEYVQHTYLAIYWLAMSNSVYNPFVYCWLNSRFRQGFRQVLCCLCYRDRINGTTRPFEHSRYHGAARYSCASEHTICITDTRVRFNGNGNITLHSTANNNNENSNNNNTNTNKKNKITISDSHTNQPQCLMADKNHPIKRMVMMKNNNNNNSNNSNNNNNNRNIGSSPATTTATTPSTTTTMASTNSTTTGSNISPLQSKLKFPQKEML